jgi:serine/threonine-protein kinase
MPPYSDSDLNQFQMTSDSTQPDRFVGVSLADKRFRVMARIGAGSMALVYRAFDHRLETEVVIKVPRKEKLLDPSLKERFQRESRLLVQLQHPHIVRIMDIGVHGSVPYVVMQYLSGGCLLDRMQTKEGKPAAMRIDSIRTWLPSVAKALDFAHQMQVVHRDVKPANILFDEHGNAFLSDFGLTKMMYGEADEGDADATGAGLVVGTPNFVAPEIVLGRDYDGRADQYSLAITVYNALIGTPPMLGKSPSATMVNQTRRVLPLLNEVRKAVPAAVAAAVARALLKKPEERFATCGEFADAVIAGLSSQPESDMSLISSRTIAPPPANAANDSTARAASDATSFRKRKPKSVPLRSIGEALPTGKVSRVKKNGAINCPNCGKEFRLSEKHAGKTGRCVKCQTRLRIAKNLATISTIPPTDPSEFGFAGSSSSAANSADDLILGEKVFGIKLSRQSLLILGIAMLAIVIGTIILFMSRMQKTELDQRDREMQLRDMNREEHGTQTSQK